MKKSTFFFVVAAVATLLGICLAFSDLIKHKTTSIGVATPAPSPQPPTPSPTVVPIVLSSPPVIVSNQPTVAATLPPAEPGPMPPDAGTVGMM